MYFWREKMGFKTVFITAALLASTSAVADVTEEFTYSYELDDGGRISVDNTNGGITVVGGSGNTVEIIAEKKGKNQDALDAIKIIIDHSSDALRVETDFPDKGVGGWLSFGDDNKGSVSYTISVPSSANLESIESVNGHVEIEGVSGTVKASTVNGSIKASDLEGNAKIETVNGSVTASFASFSGQSKAAIESVNGRLTINLPDGADASVEAETINGGIDGSDFGLETNKGFIGRDLEGDIGNGSARLSLSTVNGGIKIRND
jgi:hypothetical protein